MGVRAHTVKNGFGSPSAGTDPTDRIWEARMPEHFHSDTAPGAESYTAPAGHAKGFVASAARTIGADIEHVFAAWTDDAQRAQWLRDGQFALTDRTPGVSLHADWGTGKLRVLFMPRGAARAYVTVDHDGLPTARRAEQMTKFWRARLSRLAALVERARR